MEKKTSASSVLTWGIIALALCWSPVLGIVFACIARSRSKAFIAENGAAIGTAKVGNIFSKIAFPVSIVMTVIWVIEIIAIAGLAAAY